MQKINFQNLPSTSTPINATNLNAIQSNAESAINDVAGDLSDYVNGRTSMGNIKATGLTTTGNITAANYSDSGWVNCQTSQGSWDFCQVRKIGKVVHLRAFASSLGRPNGTIFTIPSGYRPSQQEVFYASAGFLTGYTIVRTYVNTDGSVGMDWNINMGSGQDVTANTWKRFNYTYFVD